MAYTKRKEARYIAHLDLIRVFDRALRRAGIEVVYSEGFNPHPKISFGPPLPVGVEGTEEYVDIELKIQEEIAEQPFLIRIIGDLQKQLPEGIELVDYAIMPPGSKALMAVINLARYRTEVPLLEPLSAEAFQKACDRWLTREEAMSIRLQKGKKTERNIRPLASEIAVIPIENANDNYSLIAHRIKNNENGMVFLCKFDIKTGNDGSVRPVEILESISILENVPIDLPGVLTTREGLYIRKGQDLLKPIEYIRTVQ